MGLRYQKRVRLDRNNHVNVSGRGISVSTKVGPLTFNSRGRTSLRLAPGLSYRGGGLFSLIALVVVLAGGVIQLVIAAIAAIWGLFSRKQQPPPPP